MTKINIFDLNFRMFLHFGFSPSPFTKLYRDIFQFNAQIAAFNRNTRNSTNKCSIATIEIVSYFLGHSIPQTKLPLSLKISKFHVNSIGN